MKITICKNCDHTRINHRQKQAGEPRNGGCNLCECRAYKLSAKDRKRANKETLDFVADAVTRLSPNGTLETRHAIGGIELERRIIHSGDGALLHEGYYDAESGLTISERRLREARHDRNSAEQLYRELLGARVNEQNLRNARGVVNNAEQDLTRQVQQELESQIRAEQRQRLEARQDTYQYFSESRRNGADFPTLRSYAVGNNENSAPDEGEGSEG